MSNGSPCWQLGSSLVVEAPKDSPLAAALRTVFAALEVSTVAPQARRVRLDLVSDPEQGLLLTADGLAVTRVRAPEYLPSLLEGSVGALAVQSRPDCLVFHAGCVALDQRAFMLLGGKGSGKSTLALWLARSGADYFADEHVFVRIRDLRLLAFPKAATIKKGSAALFEGGWSCPDAVRGPLRYILPATAARPGAEADLRFIALPRYDAEAENALTPLQPHETALMLVQQCFGGLGRSPDAIRAVADLARRPAYLLEYRDAAWAELTLRKLAGEFQ